MFSTGLEVMGMGEVKEFKITEFDPNNHPWHDKIIPWTKKMIQPRDGSWGFVERDDGSEIHVHAGDFIIDAFGDFHFCKKENFPEFKRKWNENLGDIWRIR